MKTLRIGDAARETGVPAHTIRFYEKSGLLPEASRGESGYREYDETELRRLRLIRNARALEIPLPEVRALLQDLHDASCREYATQVLSLVQRQQAEIDRKVAELERIRVELTALASVAAQATNSTRMVDDCTCCLLMDDAGSSVEACQPAPPPARSRGELLEILQCDIDARPTAPTLDDLAPHVLGVSSKRGELTVRFAPQAMADVRRFAAAECVCCGGLAWVANEDADGPLLTVSGAPGQIEALSAAWLAVARQR